MRISAIWSKIKTLPTAIAGDGGVQRVQRRPAQVHAVAQNSVIVCDDDVGQAQASSPHIYSAIVR